MKRPEYIAVVIDEVKVNGKQVQEAMPGSEAVLPVPAQVALNDHVFKTFDAKLIEKSTSAFCGCRCSEADYGGCEA